MTSAFCSSHLHTVLQPHLPLVVVTFTHNLDKMSGISVKGAMISEHFNAPDSDITFQSSDHVFFRLHRKNLEVLAAGFAPSGFQTNREIVKLTEGSSTLELLFQFIYPMPQPDVESMKFEDLAILAEAAEKYQVFSAIGICRLRMRLVLPAHAHEIMNYAFKHRRDNIIHEAAPILIGTPLHITVAKLLPQITLPWVLYYEKWNEVLQRATRYNWNTGTPHGYRLGQRTERHGNDQFTSRICQNCLISADNLILDIILKLNNVQSLCDLDTTFRIERACLHVRGIVAEWRKSVENDIRGIKSFVTFL